MNQQTLKLVIAFVAGVAISLFVSTGFLPAITEKLHVVVNNENDTFSITFPLPQTLVSHGDHAHTPDGPRSQWMYDQIVVPEAMAVTGVRTVVENAPREIIHHLSLRSGDKEGQACRNSTDKSEREYYILARTNLADEVVFPAPYGLMLEQGERLVLEVMTHILEPPHGPGGTYNDAVVHVELTYETPGEERFHPVQFQRLFLDDSPCGEPPQHQAFVVPTGTDQFVRQSSHDAFASVDTQVFDTPGKILARTGNIWGSKGGVSLRTYINGQQSEVYSAERGTEPWQWTMPYRYEPLPVGIGDTMTLDAVYQKNPTDKILDAAGIFGYYFAPDDPQYLLHW